MEYSILLIEDDKNDRVLIKRAFSKANIVNSLQIVKNGEEAVDYLSGKGDFSDRDKYPLPILILLDLKLPRKSGYEVLSWIRQQPGFKRIPVIVFTSLEQISSINKAYELGANSYLVKPITFDALLNMIKTLNLYWLILNKMPEV